MKQLLTVCSLFLALFLIGCTQSEDIIRTDLNSSGSSCEPTITTLSVTLPNPVTTATSEVALPSVTTGIAPSTSGTISPVTTGAYTTESTSSKTATTESAVPSPVTTTPAVTTPTVTTPATSLVTGNPAPATIESYQEDSAIIYAKETLTLYLDGKTVSVDKDIALLCTGIGDSFTRVRWQGKTAYVRTNDTTRERPESAMALAAEKGGIYYKGTGPLIAIDAGHQDHSMKDTEPLGPGSTERKAKLSSGTQGIATRLAEYKLNLSVALLLRDELIGRGYSVVMIRETNNVEMSNSERALIANAYSADAFIRIHANGSSNSSVTGAFTLCQTKKNPYNGNLYEESKRLAVTILDKYIDSTGFKKKSIWETDTMTGINWATVPVTLIEMGYMSNADEDRTMATKEFQLAAAIGMADGFDVYFGRE